VEGDLRRSAVGLIFVLVGVVSVLGLDLGVAAAAPVRIVSPRTDQLVVHGKHALPVVIKAKGHVSAWLELTGRKERAIHLHRRGNGVLRGSIPRKALRPGRDHLFVYAKPTAKVPLARAHFTVGRRVRHGLLRLGNVSPRVQSALRLKGRVAKGVVLQTELNGHRVDGEIVREGRSFHAQLAADNGMRFGRNRLTLTAFDRLSGDYRVISERFTVGRGAPLVGAGKEQTATVGSRVRLDGSSSAAGHGKLRMHWRIAKAPRHSGARLRGARSAHPTLVGGRPGVYRIALATTQTSAKPAAGAAKASSVETPTTDSTEVSLQPDVLPEGVPIETIVNPSSPEVKVNGKSYPMENPGGSFAQVVILDRATLELVKNTSVNADDGSLPVAFDIALRTASSQDLVIVSGGGGEKVGPAEFQLVSEIEDSLEEIGGVEGPLDQSRLAGGEFSVIGVPGLAHGEGTQLYGESLTPGSPAGAISGLLRIDTSGNFTFNWPAGDRAKFELGSDTGPGQNTIVIGPQTYVEELYGYETGFHMVWVNPTNLAELGQETVPATAEGLTTLAIRLTKAEEEGALVFLSSYGSPDLTAPAGTPLAKAVGEVAQKLQYFGASLYGFVGLTGSGGFSFVGRALGEKYEGIGSATELVQADAGAATDRITGELTRSKQGSFVPGSSGSPDSFSAEPLGRSVLAGVLAQPLQPFKQLPQAAETYIYEKVFTPNGESIPEPAGGIRSFYWVGGSDYSGEEFEATLLPRLRKLTCTSGCPAGLAETKATLENEFEEVQRVKHYFEEGVSGTIRGVFSSATGDGGAVFFGVQQYIDGLYGNPQGSIEAQEETDVYKGVLSVGRGVAGLIPGGGQIGATLSLIQGVGEIGQGLALGKNGESVYNPNTVKSDALEWAEHINALTVSGLEGLKATSNLLVSDEGRLRKTVELLNTPAASGGLAFDGDEESTMRVGIERSEQRYMWTTMLPLVMKVSAPFKGPFHIPPTSGDFAPQRGVTEVNVPTGEYPDSGLAPNYDIAPYVITNGVELPSEATANMLFGAIQGNQTVAQGPVGFRPKYFLVPSVTLLGQTKSFGFGVLQVCHQEKLNNYEVTESRQEIDKYLEYTVEFVPCQEAEPPYSTEIIIKG
jgi:hypothetical protein